MSHEMKFGFEVNNNSRTYYGDYYGNGNIDVRHDINSRTIDWNGDGVRDVVQTEDGFDLKRIRIMRFDTGYHDGTNRLAAYFSDTISLKRFNFNIGLRFDHAKDYVSANTYRALWSADQTPTYPLYQNFASISDTFVRRLRDGGQDRCAASRHADPPCRARPSSTGSSRLASA